MNREKIVKICVVLFILIGIPFGIIYERLYPNVKIYEGNGYGFKGDLLVKLKVNKKNKIVGLEVDHIDTPIIADPAIKKIESSLILKNADSNIKVDEVAGATYTSQGVKEGIDNAIKKIKKVVDKK